MANRKDIMVPRKKKDGGTYWVKIGTAWEGDKGYQLAFDALPIPDSEGRCVANLFEPRERGNGQQSNTTSSPRTHQPASAYDDMDENAPF